ncbi:MAG: hypothetical protein KDB17_09800 [Ilumatobacter sp.]|nr:hypothetical protein [Ilumatobacter sp.]
MDERPADRDVPSPRLVAAWLTLDVLVDPAQVPMWAAYWIADGRDTPALRELAGLDGRDPFAVRELTARTLDELHVVVDDRETAAALVLNDEAKQCLAGRTSERALAAALDDLYVRSGYADEILRQPLGAEYGIDDEWIGGWGRTDEQLREAVRAACARQLALG